MAVVMVTVAVSVGATGAYAAEWVMDNGNIPLAFSSAPTGESRTITALSANFNYSDYIERQEVNPEQFPVGTSVTDTRPSLEVEYSYGFDVLPTIEGVSVIYGDGYLHETGNDEDVIHVDAGGTYTFDTPCLYTIYTTDSDRTFVEIVVEIVDNAVPALSAVAPAPAPAQASEGFSLHETILGERYSYEDYHTFTVYLDNEPILGTVTSYNYYEPEYAIEEKSIFIPVGTTLKATVQETNGSDTRINFYWSADYPEQLSYEYQLSMTEQEEERRSERFKEFNNHELGGIFVLGQVNKAHVDYQGVLPQEITYVFDKPGVFYLNGEQSVKSNSDMGGVSGFNIYIVVTDGETLPETQAAPPASVQTPAIEHSPTAPVQNHTPVQAPATEQATTVAQSNNTAVVANCEFLHLRRGTGVSHAAFNHLTVGDAVKVID
jgi:hypothetical protein